MRARIDTVQKIARNPFLFLEVAARFAAVSAALVVCPAPRIGKFFSRRGAGRRTLDPALTHRFAVMLERRLSREPSCLRSSLVVFSMAPTKTRWIVGVDRSDAGLEAHAWVESRGKVFSASLDWARYQTIWSLDK